MAEGTGAEADPGTERVTLLLSDLLAQMAVAQRSFPPSQPWDRVHSSESLQPSEVPGCTSAAVYWFIKINKCIPSFS